MRTSLLTVNSSPTASADRRRVNSSAAIRVNPRESRLFFPMVSPWFSPSKFSKRQSITCLTEATVGIAEAHVSGAHRRCQIHALGFVSHTRQTLSHHPQVDLLNQAGGESRADGIALIGADVAEGGIDHVVGDLQIDDVVGDWDGILSVHLAHQACGLRGSAARESAGEISGRLTVRRP